MTRTHIEALALVNWRGIFYDRFGLNRRVTALEGVNGAGKTTVMIAAYVALLPDFSRLRFTTLGEPGATGGDKGIWGRLGEPGRPSYVAMDFALADEQRLVAGVHLERKGEPSVEPTPFIVWNLDKAIRLQDLLLVEQGGTDAVPELPELRQNAARLGGRLQSYTSVREYLATLFDQGVMPLRLGTDEERNKFNEMLRTSMTGGISRALTSELRSFVLREENGLADTLQRMRANLDACRRTRGEVQESRRLEQEIGGVFEAGQSMFVAAFLATRERADDLSRRVTEAQAARDHAWQMRETAKAALDKTRVELDTLEARRGELDQALRTTREWHAKLTAALAALRALEQCEVGLEQTEAEERNANGQRSEAEGRNLRSQAERQRARDGYVRAAKGLADLQQGIEELHLRAGAYRQATRRLREAQTHLKIGVAQTQSFAEHLALANNQLSDIDQQRRALKTRLADANAHRERHATLMASVRRLTDQEIEADSVYIAAIEALHRFREQCRLAEKIADLTRDVFEAKQLQTPQEQARELADQLDVAVNDASATEVVDRLLSDAEAERSLHEAHEREARDDLAVAQRQREESASRYKELLAREPKWREHSACALRLSKYLDIAVDGKADLDTARGLVNKKHTEVCNAEKLAQDEHERLLRDARELLNASGPFSTALLELKDQLGAELLAAGFEEVAIEDAAVLEARLGSLSQALIVDDPIIAAQALAGRPAALVDVLLVPRDADLQRLTEVSGNVQAGAGDVAVREGDVLRVSRIPAKPCLGRRARERHVEELRAQATAKAGELDNKRSERRDLERLIADGDALLEGMDIWLAGDPTNAIHEAHDAIALADNQIERHREAVSRHAQKVQELLSRTSKLRALLANARLLGPPDYTQRAQTLGEELARAHDAKVWSAARAEDAKSVEDGLVDLRQLPLSEQGMTNLNLSIEKLDDQRTCLDAGIEALEYLCDNAEALTWEEAPRRLEANRQLTPALQEQLHEAEVLQQIAESQADQAQSDFDAANAHFLRAADQHRDARQAHTAATKAFYAWNVPTPTEDAITSLAIEIDRMEKEFNSHGPQRDALLTAIGGQEIGLQNADQDFATADEKLANERRDAEPARKRWEQLLSRAMSAGLVGDLLTQVPEGFADIRGHVNFVQIAASKRDVLQERLRVARGGEILLAELQSLHDTGEATFADAILDRWLTVRDWLHRRLPAQVAEVDDPREALARLHDQLRDLEERLARQENELRGASEDVARGIDVQIRKARGQITRLSKNLEAVSFGNIQGIQVTMQQVDRMEKVLNALKEGAAQELLFQANMPIEEALDEIFRRYGGGRSGGQRLLDYREYVHLQVEIRRNSSATWDPANPSQLSTGEAIGVGAALMMVVLTEWERDATLLRGKRAHGSLRFLFLDEANRLSQDNLGVLFDLCQTLDLQLMIAAPEVARAEGNTTYRLVRQITPDGREEVLVSGRRARGDD
ncbi:chromosome partition protein MukB [Burkholderia ambifaria]|uniref:chromosome partition protein MukB n=1 Tax=Burkholderia ambifaria TaxID=152480 RepID=UPI00158EEF6B|nr:chromosome partition protein MukB [Burkholderia ambifaria]